MVDTNECWKLPLGQLDITLIVFYNFEHQNRIFRLLFYQQNAFLAISIECTLFFSILLVDISFAEKVIPSSPLT